MQRRLWVCSHTPPVFHGPPQVSPTTFVHTSQQPHGSRVEPAGQPAGAVQVEGLHVGHRKPAAAILAASGRCDRVAE